MNSTLNKIRHLLGLHINHLNVKPLSEMVEILEDNIRKNLSVSLTDDISTSDTIVIEAKATYTNNLFNLCSAVLGKTMLDLEGIRLSKISANSKEGISTLLLIIYREREIDSRVILETFSKEYAALLNNHSIEAQNEVLIYKLAILLYSVGAKDASKILLMSLLVNETGVTTSEVSAL